jgi:18S rRNA (guanine1575-N7)-methyltransferase
MEEFYVIPETYFSKEAARNYDKSPRMKKVQHELTERAVELLELDNGKVLDVGCGTGFSMQVLVDHGLECIGIDISQPMLDIAKSKGFKVRKADFTKLPFKDRTFDAIISISSLQWVYGKSYDDVVDKYSSIAKEFYRVLKSGGKAVVQFYPKTEKEFDIVVKKFKSAKFSVTIAIDYPDIKKRTKKFIILEKR